ncbi:hypothetical protein SAMN05446635_3146 [Burkholderia sp. OK233]|nr:hypothetical protein SAMN05446635_3146 [Burkholderia sp. OK233]
MASIPVDATAFMLHGVSTWFFFYRGKRLGRATGWHGLGQFEAAVAVARDKIRVANVICGADEWRKKRQKFDRLKKIKDRIVKEVLKTMRTHLC